MSGGQVSKQPSLFGWQGRSKSEKHSQIPRPAVTPLKRGTAMNFLYDCWNFDLSILQDQAKSEKRKAEESIYFWSLQDFKRKGHYPLAVTLKTKPIYNRKLIVFLKTFDFWKLQKSSNVWTWSDPCHYDSARYRNCHQRKCTGCRDRHNIRSAHTDHSCSNTNPLPCPFGLSTHHSNYQIQPGIGDPM